MRRPAHISKKIATRSIAEVLHTPEFCPMMRDGFNPNADRRCKRADGSPKRWYVSRAAAKAVAKKYHSVYRCASGVGYHIGNPPRTSPAKES